MAETAKQPVVTETKEPTKSAPEATDARKAEPSLDDLLAEFGTKTREAAKPSTPETKPATATDPNLVEQVNTLSHEFARYASRADMDATIKAIRGDLDPEVFDDVLVESWLDSQARQDPRLTQAWLERREKPKQFEKVRAELGRSFGKKFSKLPDKAATEDREAVTAAVRGASTKAPEDRPPSYGSMSNQQVREDIEKRYGYTPNV